MTNFKKGNKVIYNVSKDSVHHIGRIVAIDDFLHVQFMFGKPMTFPLTGYDKLFNRQLVVVDESYEV